MNIAIILAEVSLVVLVFLLVNWLFNKFSKRLTKVSMLRNEERNIKIVRRSITKVLLLLCLVLCILIVGFNGFLIYRGENLEQYTLGLIYRVPPQFWISLGIGILQSIGTLIVAGIVIKVVHSVLNIASIRAKNFEQSTADDESIDRFFRALKKIVSNGIWLWALILSAQYLKLPAVVSEYLYILLRIYLIVGVGQIILKAVNAIIDTLDALTIRYTNPDNILRFYDRFRHLIPFFKQCVESVIWICIATLVVQQIPLSAKLAPWGGKFVQIIAIVFISRILIEISYLLLEEGLANAENLSEIQKQKNLTLIPLFRSFLQYFIYFGAGICVLYTLKIDPTPILAGAGIVGIAVGLGAQNLINDIVSGFFILFENYYLVGDYIEAGKVQDRNVEGIVEAIELRTTRVRHPNGQLQIIRNGEVGSITNYSKQYIYAVVELSVAYDSNLAHVYRVIEEVGEQLKTDYPDILEATQVDGVENIGESGLLLRTLTKVNPGKHLQIQRVLRKVLMSTFIQEGIATTARAGG
ncbi:mechanosensitive ion channel family protein [Brasilonema sp. CT11]|nr:mechanosensitive ion channel family protein [Brasilonema sp. CT11]